MKYYRYTKDGQIKGVVLKTEEDIWWGRYPQHTKQTRLTHEVTKKFIAESFVQVSEEEIFTELL